MAKVTCAWIIRRRATSKSWPKRLPKALVPPAAQCRHEARCPRRCRKRWPMPRILSSIQKAPVAVIDDLANYDAIVVGTGTRFGRMSSQMAAFLDQAGGLWMKRCAERQGWWGVWRSTATQHGGQGDDAVLDHREFAALRSDHCRSSIQPSRPDECQRNRGRLALWRQHRSRVVMVRGSQPR